MVDKIARMGDSYFRIGGWGRRNDLVLSPLRMSALASNQRFERSRGRLFGEPRRESMIEINPFRLSPAQPRVAQPHC